MNSYSAVNSYASVKVHSGVESASPHRLIQMLFEGALERIAQAKGAISQKQFARKGELISKAAAIVGGLQGDGWQGAKVGLLGHVGSLGCRESQILGLRVSDARPGGIGLIEMRGHVLQPLLLNILVEVQVQAAIDDALDMAFQVGPLSRALADQPDDIRIRAAVAVRVSIGAWSAGATE